MAYVRGHHAEQHDLDKKKHLKNGDEHFKVE